MPQNTNTEIEGAIALITDVSFNSGFCVLFPVIFFLLLKIKSLLWLTHYSYAGRAGFRDRAGDHRCRQNQVQLPVT